MCKKEVEVWPVTIKGVVEYRNENGNQGQVIESLRIKTKNLLKKKKSDFNIVNQSYFIRLIL